jgi:hypothetical protein
MTGSEVVGEAKELLLSPLRGSAKLVDVCREHYLKQSEVESWMETFSRRANAAAIALAYVGGECS